MQFSKFLVHFVSINSIHLYLYFQWLNAYVFRFFHPVSIGKPALMPSVHPKVIEIPNETSLAPPGHHDLNQRLLSALKS